MSELSDDAKVIAGALFGIMKTTVRIGRAEKLTPRGRAAFDELVSSGVLSVEPFNKFGGLVYKPLVDCHEHLAFALDNSDKSFTYYDGADHD